MKKRYDLVLVIVSFLVICGCNLIISEKDETHLKEYESTQNSVVVSITQNNSETLKSVTTTTEKVFKPKETSENNVIEKNYKITLLTGPEHAIYDSDVWNKNKEITNTSVNVTENNNTQINTTQPDLTEYAEYTEYTEFTQSVEKEIPETSVEEESEETQEITDTSIIEETEVGELPQIIKNEVEKQTNKYPGIDIAVGIYSLNGEKGYTYNENAIISGACTIKAPYAMYVLKSCEEQNISIWEESIVYEEWMKNNGSGEIKNAEYGTEYSISYLLNVLLGISDNTAYNMLVSKFPLSEYQKFLNEIDGQQLNGAQYGAVSVVQRKNEWIAIYNYINSQSRYSEVLKEYITNTKYCYIVQGMQENHMFMHKSGWSNSKTYTSASDCAIIDDNYLVIVLTQDYSTGIAHTDSVRAVGAVVEEYANSLGGYIF